MSNLPATFVDRVKERVNEHITGLVPDEELTQLIEVQVKNFQREELPRLIKAEIAAHFTAAIKTEMAKPEYNSTWDGYGKKGASDVVKKMIEENAGAVLQSLIGGMIQITVDQMRNNQPRIY